MDLWQPCLLFGQQNWSELQPGTIKTAYFSTLVYPQRVARIDLVAVKRECQALVLASRRRAEKHVSERLALQKECL